jgi:hypothetical protein
VKLAPRLAPALAHRTHLSIRSAVQLPELWILDTPGAVLGDAKPVDELGFINEVGGRVRISEGGRV